MEKKLNDLYVELFEKCKSALPIEWSEVKLWTEKYDQEDVWDYHACLNYKGKDGKWYRAADIEDDFSREKMKTYMRNMPSEVVEKMYDVLDEAGMEKFKVLEFCADDNGNMTTNFQYEYSRGETFLERMILWEYETIGFTGNDYQKGIIKKYHPEFDYTEE